MGGLKRSRKGRRAMAAKKKKSQQVYYGKRLARGEQWTVIVPLGVRRLLKICVYSTPSLEGYPRKHFGGLSPNASWTSRDALFPTLSSNSLSSILTIRHCDNYGMFIYAFLGECRPHTPQPQRGLEKTSTARPPPRRFTTPRSSRHQKMVVASLGLVLQAVCVITFI